MFDKDGLFIILLLAHSGIGFTVIAIGLFLNLRMMRDQDGNWRVVCSWVSLALFATAVIADAIWDKGPISAHHVWQLSVFSLAALGMAFILGIVGKGLGRVFIVITSLAFCWLYFGTAHHPR